MYNKICTYAIILLLNLETIAEYIICLLEQKIPNSSSEHLAPLKEAYGETMLSFAHKMRKCQRERGIIIFAWNTCQRV